MQTIASLVDFVSPRPKNDAPQSTTERAWVAATAVLASVGLSGVWGRSLGVGDAYRLGSLFGRYWAQNFGG